MAATNPLNFSGRVAIVTGAGGGLGREYALLLAARGASVVVNDLGGSRSGEGKSSSAADVVVQEIRSKGGKAVADYNSVEDGEKIIQTAIKNFGRIDILINNAGILRDKAFVNISIEEWDIIHRVHLRGSFLVTRAAWPYFRKQNYGRIIMTSSGAGIYGNFGQSNYSAAKLGLLGLSNTLAIEGKKYNIHCNTIVPVAASRLTEDIMPPDILKQLQPSCVSPVVAWLCHENCSDSGSVIEAAGGWVGKYQWQKSVGKAFIPPSRLTPEAVRDNWDSITDMSDTFMPTSLQESTMSLLDSLTNGTSKKPNEKVWNVEDTNVRDTFVSESDVFKYNEEKAILYALAVGMSTDEPCALSFLYEGEEDFRVLPTFGTICVMNALFSSEALRTEVENLNADPTKLLHGEQYLELYQPLSPGDVLSSKCRLLDVLDKGSGAVVIFEADTFNEKGEKVMRTEWTIFLVGCGNFGGKRNSDKSKKVLPLPNRKPDAVIEEKTSVDQAALYRLVGDKNPMHIDPSFAAIAGFSQPILHGLCTLGYANRHVLKQYANYDVKQFKSIMARFARPILPGQTIRTEMWREGPRIHFVVKCVETGKLVISDAYVDLNDVPTLNGSVKSASPLQSRTVFKIMADQLTELPDLAQKIQAVYEWNILQNGEVAGVWTLDLKNGAGKLVEGTISGLQPGVTLSIEDEDMVAMVNGKLDPQKAFLTKKLKLKGDIMLTQKLKPLLSLKKKPAPEVDMKCDKIFEKLGERLKKNPDLAGSIQTVYQWNILKDGKHISTWTLDLKNDSGAVYKGAPKHDKPDCTFILEDDLFTKIMDGTEDPQKAFMSRKLKITGNILASQKLQAIWDNPEDDDTEKVSFAGPNDVTSKPPVADPHQLGAMPATLKSDFVFQIFAERLGEEPELAKKMKVVYNWNILQSGKKITEWTVDLKTGAGSIYRGPPKSGKADVTMTMDDEDVILMMLGKLNPQKAFMTGRLRIKGNIMLTQKLNQLWQEILKSGKAVELPILSAILADKPFDPKLRSEPCFVELGKRVSRQPELVQKFNTVLEWNVTKNGELRTQWILDLKVENCMLSRGPAKNGVVPDAKITVDDDIFADWILFKISVENVLSSPKTKIEGDKEMVAKLLDCFKMASKL